MEKAARIKKRNLIQRVKLQRSKIISLEKRKFQLNSALNNEKFSLKHLQNEYDKLKKKYNEQKEYLHSLQENELTIRNSLEVINRDIVTVLQPLRHCAESLKKNIGGDFNISHRERPRISNGAKNISAVSPMVGGHVFKKPAVALERLSANQLLNYTRTRSYSDFIPRSHSYPVVRLRDVARLISNSACISLNLQLSNEQRFGNSSTSELSLQPSPAQRGDFSLSSATSNRTEKIGNKRYEKFENSDGESD